MQACRRGACSLGYSPRVRPAPITSGGSELQPLRDIRQVSEGSVNSMSLLNPRFNLLAEFKGLLAKLPTIGFNLINTVVYLVTLGGKTLHEGRYSRRRQRWFNWNRV